MAKIKSRPQAYPAMSFHLVRAVAFVSQSIVSGILIWFCLRLKSDGFKLPWTFLIVLAASLLSIITLAITTIFYMCSYLSPLFNLIINSSIALIQFVGFILLSWNMYGTLGHSCSASNWANADGLMVCRIYKAFYSFALFAMLAQIALIVLDVRSRSAQTKLGKYGNIEDPKNIKLDQLDRTSAPLDAGAQPGGHVHQPSHASSVDSVPYGIDDFRDQPTRPAPYQATYQPPYQPVYQEPNESAYQPPAYQPRQYQAPASSSPTSQVRADPFGGYGQTQQSAPYGNGGYGYGNGSYGR